jgi:molecular chaperone IbpA
MQLVPTLFKDFDKYFVGFDDHVNRLQKLGEEVAKNIPNYPPYNIKKTGENSYVVELACAGFGKSEIDIELDGDKLVIRGNTSEDTTDYIVKGIANRAFTRTFSLMDNIEVKNAELINGMLKVYLEGQHQLAKKIKIDVK